jgi:hypothetical protein
VRRKNKMDMTISEQIQNVSDRVCHEICKYYAKNKNLSSADYEKIMQEHCLHCPIIEL